MHRMTWSDDLDLDRVMVIYFDELYFKGHSVEMGSSTLAALRYFVHAIKRGGPGRMPRSAVVLRTWRRRDPPQQRLPLPWIALCAMMGWLLFRHAAIAVELCLKWVLGFRLYLRPGENDSLRTEMIVHPQPLAGIAYGNVGLILSPREGNEPGKTGLYDEAVIWDTEVSLHPLLLQLVQARGPNVSLWTIPADQDMELFRAASTAMHLEGLHPVRYAMRHGGASDDLLCRRHSVQEVMRRGRWRTDVSLRRYGKETRILDEVNKLPRAVLEFGAKVSANLESLLLGQVKLRAIGPVPA